MTQLRMIVVNADSAQPLRLCRQFFSVAFSRTFNYTIRSGR